MTKARSRQIDLQATPYYHCISRCVRRAFLCGEDRFTGQSFDHRKQWIVERIRLLGDVYAIDIAAYAIMSNHYHLVLHVDTERAEAWSRDEVILRWLKLFKGPMLIHRYLRHEPLTQAELLVIDELVAEWRQRLSSISWFMSGLNEYIAREANKEDHCTGRFWEGRFKSQALLDEAALISCMAYVDLNPVRAAIAEDLKTSDFTSIQERLRQVSRQIEKDKPRLMPFIEAEHQDRIWACLPFNLQDYIDLVDWTGRTVREDKRGFIPQHIPAILEKINLTREQWQVLSMDIQKQSIAMLHGLERLAQHERRTQARLAA